jgi:16S rRNA (guanine966-N2)-methyltransferase
VIARNAEAARVDDRVTVRRMDVAAFLQRRSKPADLVLLDPPYETALDSVIRTLRALAAGSWIRSGGTVVVEAPAGQVSWPSGFRETRTRRSGRTQVSMAVDDGSGDLSRDV